MLDRDDINTAIDGKFTKFSDRVKQELQGKIAGHEYSKEYAAEYDRIDTMRQRFADVHRQNEE